MSSCPPGFCRRPTCLSPQQASANSQHSSLGWEQTEPLDPEDPKSLLKDKHNVLLAHLDLLN